MANDENPDSITDDTEQEMIREALQVHAPDIALADREGLRSLRGQLYVMPQLGIKVIGKFWCRNPLVVPHDLVDIRVYLRMQDEASGSAATYLLIDLLQRQAGGRIRSRSASRRSASAIPSSPS